MIMTIGPGGLRFADVFDFNNVNRRNGRRQVW